MSGSIISYTPNTPDSNEYSGLTGEKKSTPVLYQDPSGETKTGYIVDGKTYADPDAKTRVEQGSIVYTQGGAYILQGDKGVPYKAGTAMGSNATLNQIAQQSAAAINQQYDATISNLEGSRAGIGLNYDDIAREAYVNYKLGNMDLAEYLSPFATGKADSLRLRSDLNYQNNLQKNERAREADMAELDRKIADMNAKRNAALADNNISMLKNQYELEKAAEKEEKAAAQREADTAYDNAWTLIKNGIADEDIAKAAGITYEQARTLAEAALEKNAAGKKTTTSSSSSRSSSKGTKSDKNDEFNQNGYYVPDMSWGEQVSFITDSERPMEAFYRLDDIYRYGQGNYYKLRKVAIEAEAKFISSYTYDMLLKTIPRMLEAMHTQDDVKAMKTQIEEQLYESVNKGLITVKEAEDIIRKCGL